MHFKGQETFKFPAGVENIKKAFKDRFPELIAEIDVYYHHVERAAHVFKQKFIFHNITPRWVGALLQKIANREYNFYEDKTVQMMNDLVFGEGKNEEIKGIITGQFGDYGVMPNKASFILQGGLHMHYAKHGGWYPKGGSEILATRMCECIYKHGGKVLVKADVKNIIVGEDGNAIGVTCSTDGKTNTIYASEIISTVGVVNTYNLLGEKYHDARLKRI